jgi:hypothetical protein
MDLKQVRAESIQAAKKLGVEILPTLPLMDSGLEVRDKNEMASRLLAMHAVAASAYGFDRAKVTAWLNQEGLTDSLSKQEKQFAFEHTGESDRFKMQIEAIWALAWAMGIVKELNFAKDCDDRFVAQLPNLKQSQSSADFRKRINPRPLKEIVSACDLAYCLHWAIRQSEIDGKRLTGNLKPYVVIERRRALEWLLSKEEWDNVPLDT